MMRGSPAKDVITPGVPPVILGWAPSQRPQTVDCWYYEAKNRGCNAFSLADAFAAPPSAANSSSIDIRLQNALANVIGTALAIWMYRSACHILLGGFQTSGSLTLGSRQQ